MKKRLVGVAVLCAALCLEAHSRFCTAATLVTGVIEKSKADHNQITRFNFSCLVEENKRIITVQPDGAHVDEKRLVHVFDGTNSFQLTYIEDEARREQGLPSLRVIIQAGDRIPINAPLISGLWLAYASTNQFVTPGWCAGPPLFFDNSEGSPNPASARVFAILHEKPPFLPKSASWNFSNSTEDGKETAFTSSDLASAGGMFFPKKFKLLRFSRSGTQLETFGGSALQLGNTNERVGFPLNYRRAEVLDARYIKSFSRGKALRYYLTNSVPAELNGDEVKELLEASEGPSK